MALCLGALVGLERQVAQEESRGAKDFPGVRTFAFTALVGALSVLTARQLDPWIAVALFLAIVTFLVVRYRYDASERGDPGYTTEIASLCTFAIGVIAQSGQLLVATVITIAMVALLRSKRALHRAGDLLSPVDMEVLIRFLIITGIVLPLVPDEAFGPFGVLRPRDIWRMVVLISGLSFVGYVLMRVGASARSYLLSGLLGGLVSSTATALAYARAARDAATPRRYEALVILGASTAFVRIAIVLGVVAPVLLLRVAPVLIVMLAVGLALGFLAHRAAPQAVEPHVYSNPLSMKAALAFAGIYALVLFLSAAAGEYFAEAGTYAVTGLAAMVGADAPTLSLARLATGGQVGFEPAAWGISMVAITATLGKVGVVLLTGRGEFVRRVSLALVVMAAAGTAVLSQL